MMATNPHELRNRSLKVGRITNLIDGMTRKAGVDPDSAHGIHVIRTMLEGWGPKHWLQCVITVGGTEPSEHTKNLVKDHYRRRALERGGS